MSLFEALKLVVLGVLLIFLAAECSSRTRPKVERLRAISTDTSSKSP